MLWVPRSGISVVGRLRAKSGSIGLGWLRNVGVDWGGGVLGLGVLIS